MTLWNQLTLQWARVRHDLATNGGVDGALDTRSWGTMLLMCVLLTMYYTYGSTRFFRRSLAPTVSQWFDAGEFTSLLPYGYWASMSVLIRVLIPLACIVLVFRESPKDYGFRMWEKGHGKIYAGLYLLMLPLLIGVSFLPSFQSKYPFYSQASESWIHFLSYELAYGVQFAALESFFRGFVIFALFRRFGFHAVVIMTIPYCMIHFGKPLPETLGSIIAGLALGYMALKSKSWLPGALLHWSIGFTMDVLCLGHKL